MPTSAGCSVSSSELRETSQLIVITHQKRTMEIADALYGVSMRQDGVLGGRRPASGRARRELTRDTFRDRARRHGPRRDSGVQRRAPGRIPHGARPTPCWPSAGGAVGWRHGRELLVARCARCAACSSSPTIDETTWDDLETALLTADFGPDITERIIDELREKVEQVPHDRSAGPAADAEGDARGALRQVRHHAAAHRASGRRARRRRERRRQDHDHRQVREVPAALRAQRRRRGRRHVPRRGRRPARDVGRARGSRDRPPPAGGPGSGIRRLPDDRLRQAHRHRDRARRHGRPPAHQGRAHGRARQDPPGHREAGADQRGAARARRDDRPERRRCRRRRSSSTRA